MKKKKTNKQQKNEHTTKSGKRQKKYIHYIYLFIWYKNMFLCFI